MARQRITEDEHAGAGGIPGRAVHEAFNRRLHTAWQAAEIRAGAATSLASTLGCTSCIRSLTKSFQILSDCYITSAWWIQVRDHITRTSHQTNLYTRHYRVIWMTLSIANPAKRSSIAVLQAEGVAHARLGIAGSSAKRINQCVKYALLLDAPGRSVRRAISRSAAATRASGRRCRWHITPSSK